MITLFIDTSNQDVSIALLKDGKIINKITKSIPNEHSKYAVSYIDEVLKKSEITPKEVQSIMVVNGPGSFTGVRIGLTIAKVYALLNDIKVTLISSLKCLAIGNNKNKYILSLINARNDNYYIGFYDNNYNDVINEHFGNIEEVNDIINKYNDVLVVSNNSDIDNVKVINELDIESIYNYYKDSEKVNPHMVLPNYLKLPQVLEKNV
ncbi:MAG: tRNA (adenosine(37)-N6)-threonylcarbamoyltransferase complex dimerization subunit type 1 TsaB [Bacilli bacterium]|nr:tRNA (adenosine(37)-N6)-threonylcarbamoyltransferase complex dimerization subunit type 1 TsaB [Bacilli bacterium]